ncbi:hypothetical protein GYMLUDRAFT_36817 [Collybiopsis luxurians FD-317 M1]|nr:hypothetical protein GYMLUDRAFT_36817 [Collybiopsis luxurians FD-317 M1]
MTPSLSIFTRPHSPPPRAVSPAFPTFNPLPLPPARPKKMSDRSALSNSYQRQTPPRIRNTPSRGILKHTPPPSPTSPTSISSSSSSSRASTHTLSHRRSLQFAVPYRSPPASPTLTSPPPPVPPIPAFALDGASGVRASSVGHSVTPSASTLSPPPTRSPRREPREGPGSSNGGMTCTEFMSMRGAQTAPGRRSVAKAPSTA